MIRYPVKSHNKAWWIVKLVMKNRWNMVRIRQLIDTNQSPLRGPKANIYGKKILFCLWWDSQCTVCHKLLKINLTITIGSYVQKLQNSRKSPQQASCIHPASILQSWKNNAWPHATKVTRERILELWWFFLPHLLLCSDKLPIFFPPNKTFWNKKPLILKNKLSILSKISPSSN